MSSYPATRRKGQTEALEYEERERLFDRGLDRPQMNSLMRRLQDHLGSKNKLGEAIYDRKLAASNIKKVVEGTTRYTDTVIDKVLLLADRLGVPRIVTEPVAANDDRSSHLMDVSNPEHGPAEHHEADAAELEEGKADEKEMPAPEMESDASDHSTRQDVTPSVQASGDQPVEEDVAPPMPIEAAPQAETVAESVSEAPAPSDWLSGVRSRRADFERQAAEHDEEITERVARVAAIEEEIRDLTARRATALSAVGEIDNALAILQTI